MEISALKVLTEVICIKDSNGTPQLDYVQDIMRHVISEWKRRKHPLPPYPANSTGRPLDEESRAYQEVRGAGHGRSLPQRRVSFEMPRVPEAGDSQVVSNVAANFIKMVDRFAEKGKPLEAGQQRQWLAIELLQRPAEGTLYFWEAEGSAGDKACCSNYYRVDFSDQLVAGGPFETVEQYFQFMKAAHAGDMTTAALIRSEEVPGRCRYLGRKVSHFDAETWALVARQVAERAIFLKFNQHPKLRAFLAGTGNAELVEASPTDALWGIGVTAADAPFVPRSTWGTNWLGHALMRVRARLPLGIEPPMPAALRLALDNNGLWRAPHAPRGGDLHRAGASPNPGGAGGKATPSVWAQRPVRLSDMEVIARHLGPDYHVLERGGQGRCFPNSMGEGLARVGLEEHALTTRT